MTLMRLPGWRHFQEDLERLKHESCTEGIHASIRKTLVISATAYEGLRLPRLRQWELLQKYALRVDKHIRLSFGIVHSIKIYSTISKITVRPREIGTGGTGVTSNHDNEAHRGSDSVFYSLIWALQSEWLFLRASAHTLLNFHCLRVTVFAIRSHGEYYLKIPFRVLVN